MHRPSALNDLFAPLAHHWTDATHITYGVLTAGLFTRTLKLEGTLFNGREPDEHRYDFDFHPLDSYGARLSVNPTPQWAISASYGYLKRPEELRPDENQHRIGISVLHSIRLGRRAEWASALIYGGNKHVLPTGGGAAGWEHSVIAESNLQEFGLGAIVLGYIRKFAAFSGATMGIAARGALNLGPRSVEDVYGSRFPAGLAVFLRVRPALLEGAHMMHGAGGM